MKTVISHVINLDENLDGSTDLVHRLVETVEGEGGIDTYDVSCSSFRAYRALRRHRLVEVSGPLTCIVCVVASMGGFARRRRPYKLPAAK